MDIVPTSEALGTRVEHFDLDQPLSEDDFSRLLRALGAHGRLINSVPAA
jgi:hypothetical protein